jgi:hypothetical protein
MSDSEVSYDYFYVDVTDPSLTHLWVFCRSDWFPAHGWRHKVLPASEPWVLWLANGKNFDPMSWDRGAPPLRIEAANQGRAAPKQVDGD